MYKKKCPFCLEASYSSERNRDWLCPNCEKDLSGVKCFLAEECNRKQYQTFNCSNNRTAENNES